MAVLEDLLSLFDRIVQPVPGDPTGTQLALRSLSRNTTPVVHKTGTVIDLSLGQPLDETTDFEGPWRLSILAIKFENTNGSPDATPKTLIISVILGDEEFVIIERANWTGTALTMAQNDISLGAADQIRVHISGTHGIAKYQLRGEAT